jgi:hypothetical protein
MTRLMSPDTAAQRHKPTLNIQHGGLWVDSKAVWSHQGPGSLILLGESPRALKLLPRRFRPAPGRQQQALTTEGGKLNELLNSHLRVQEDNASLQDILRPRTTIHPNGHALKQAPAKFTKSRTSPGTAMCKWVWAQAPKVTLYRGDEDAPAHVVQ